MLETTIGVQKFLPLRADARTRNEWAAAFEALRLTDMQAHRPYWDMVGRMDWRYLERNAYRFGQAFIRLCKYRYRIPLVATLGYRDPDTQTEMYVRGETELQAWQSRHNWGLALNFEVVHHSFDIMTDKQLQIMEQIGEEAARNAQVRIQWGGKSKPRHWDIFVPYPFDWALPILPPASAERSLLEASPAST